MIVYQTAYGRQLAKLPRVMCEAPTRKWSTSKKLTWVLNLGRATADRILNDHIQAEVNRAYNLRQQFEQLNNRLVVNGNAIKAQGPDFNTRQQAAYQMIEKRSRLMAQYNETNEDISIDLLSQLDSPRPLKLSITNTHPQAVLIDKWVDSFRTLIGGVKLQSHSVVIRPVTDAHEGHDRSFYDDDTKEIRVRRSPQEALIFHEMGHYFEHNLRGASELAKDYLEQRTNGNSVEYLEDADPLHPGYQRHEKCRDGSFVEPYVGKWYQGRATEVLSMAMQLMVEDPTKLIVRDKNLLWFSLGVIMAAKRGGFPWVQ